MKRIHTIAALVLMVCSLSVAQGLLDTANFTIAAQIKPSDFAEWPDNVAAWRVYGTYDLDNDGKKEFLVIVDPASTSSDTSMPTLLRFEANGDNTYALVWSTQIPGARSGVYSWPCLTVADLDKDGKQELIYGQPINGAVGPNPNPDVIYFYEYDSDLQNLPSAPTMTSNLGFPALFYYAITSIVADDVDADGDIELVLSARRAYGGGMWTSSTRPLLIYHLTGDVSAGFSSLDMEFADSIGTFNGGYYFNNHVLDFDGDGLKEIWGFTWDMIAFAVYEATGKDTYELRADVNQVTNPTDYGEQNSVAFYDANKDGKPEMFLAGQTSPPSAVFYLPNTTDLPSLNTTSLKRITPEYDLNFQGADIGDLDGDGEIEFYIGDWSSDARAVYRLRHINGQTFDDTSGYTFDTLYYAASDSTYEFPNVFVADDIDGDDKKEVIIVNTNTRDGFADVGLIVLESKHVVTNVPTDGKTLPSSFTLMQNYPNPFNPSTKIQFALPVVGNVSLTVFDMLGREVATLVNGMKDAGTHTVPFNARNLASGLYFYTLKSGSFVETKKMMLMK